MPESDRPLKQIFAVPYAETREGYLVRGRGEAPPFDFARKIKKWWEPKAVNLNPRQYLYTVIARDEKGGMIIGPDGTIETMLMLYDRSDADAVNYPPPGTSSSLPDPEDVPLDTSKLGPEERLVLNKMNQVVIRNMRIYREANDSASDFRTSDREALIEIRDWVRSQKA